MGLEYNGIPRFNRDRNISLSSIPRAQLDAIIDKPTAESEEDKVFDSMMKTFLKGEALKKAIGEMDPAGFIPVEPESPVVVCLQRMYPDSAPYDAITFGQFKLACEFIAGQCNAMDEDWLLTYNAVDPKLEHSKTTVKHKDLSNGGNDWISCFIEQLSPYAGMLIAGSMVQLSTAIFPYMGVDTKGDTGEVKTWSIQGMPVAVALLIELGWTIAEYERLYKDSNCPQVVKDTIKELANDPKAREKVLSDAGYDYAGLKNNQRYNDHLAIKDYAIGYIYRHQDNLNYAHWVSYSQVVESQAFAVNTASMAPVFSNKWRQAYTFGNHQNDPTNIDAQDIERAAAVSLNVGLSNYIRDIDRTLNTSYDKMYQSLTFEVDPNLVCCLVYVLGPIDVSTLRQISSLLKIASRSFHFEISTLTTKLTESLVVGYLHMLNSYLSQIIHEVCRDLNHKLSKAHADFAAVQTYCLGIKPITLGLKVALQSLIDFVLDISKALNGMINNISNKEIVFAENLAVTKTTVALAAFIDRIANGIESAQQVCNFNPAFEGLNDATWGFVTMDLGKMHPVMKTSEEDRRKHFSNIPGYTIESMGVEVPGTDEAGVMNVYQSPAPNCMDPTNIAQNTALGQNINTSIQGNS